MTSGLRRRARDLAVVLLAASVALCAAARAEDWPPLQPARLSDGPVVRPFQEERWITLLTEPLHLSGTLSVDSAGRLAKTIVSPRSERLVVDGQQVTVERPAGTVVARLSLRADPVAAALVTAIRALVNADRARLSAAFAITVATSDGEWSMTLVPATEAVRDAVTSVLVRGRGGALISLEINETNGDRSVLTLGGDE